MKKTSHYPQPEMFYSKSELIEAGYLNAEGNLVKPLFAVSKWTEKGLCFVGFRNMKHYLHHLSVIDKTNWHFNELVGSQQQKMKGDVDLKKSELPKGLVLPGGNDDMSQSVPFVPPC